MTDWMDRQLDAETVEEFAGLYCAVFNAPPWSDGWTEAAATERLQAFLSMPRSLALGLAVDGRPAALAVGWGERWVGDWHFHLKEMCVAPPLQGGGVGRELMRRLEKRLAEAGFSRVYLETGRSAPARGFYEAQGYADLGLVCLSKRLEAEATRDVAVATAAEVEAEGVRDAKASDARALHALLCANGWGHRIGTLEAFGQLLKRSQRTAVVSVDGQVAGFARGITDGLSNGYLSMVVVAPAHRGRGLGSALVRHVMGERAEITWVLRAGRDGAPAFFGKLGFVTSGSAMERARTQARQHGERSSP